MEKFIINPENYKSSYIENLNSCFNGWGAEMEYDWVFNRPIGKHPSDILLIKNDEDGVIAGSGITYRRLSGKSYSIEVGIMTGSWTLPAARRKGCFTKIINCSKDLCAQKDVPLLTAFVTESNPSCRRLRSEGSFLFPTYHLFSPEKLYLDDELPHPEVLNPSTILNKIIFETVQARQSGFISFQYNFEEFCGQYIKRIKKTTILGINNDFAILEDGTNEVKILLLTYEDEKTFRLNIKAVVNWIIDNTSKKAFYFTSRPQLRESCEKLEFENVPGYFTILSSRSDKRVPYGELADMLNINMADKM